MIASDEILERIRASCYWRVNFRPTEFDERRIPSLGECKDIMLRSQVSLRGWSYPQMGELEIHSGQDYVEGGGHWASPEFEVRYIEFWRFFQSAQFVHYFACREDQDRVRNVLGPDAKILGILSTLFSLTEIFEFVARVAEKSVLTPGVELTVQLHGMKDRQLYQPDRAIFQTYISHIDEISIKEVVDIETLIAERHELALKATCEVFERFNWYSVPRDIFAEDQRKLLEKRW